MPGKQPVSRGFFDPVAARDCYLARRSDLIAAGKLKVISEALSEGSTERVKALFPAVKDLGGVAPVAVAQTLCHLSDATQQKRLRGGVMPKGDGGADQPDLGQQGQLQGNGVDAFGDAIFDHSSSPADVGTSQGKARAEVLKGASAPPRPEAPPIPFTTWRTAMHKLVAVCRRPDSEWADDLIGVVGLFLLVFIILACGGAK